MCTGINSRNLGSALAAAALFLLASTSHAQSLKLVSLLVPPEVQSGSWISYQVNVAFKNRPPKRVTQRLAVVSREGIGEEAGAWIELKTVDSGKIRLERGYFALPERSAANAKMTLARYQRLMPDGRLLEYPVGEEGAPMADDDISAMDLIEFAGSTTTETLAADTLRVEHRVVPCAVERVRRYGMKDWQGDDTTYVNRAVMTRTDWRNAGVPVTGNARSVIEVSTERVPVGVRAPADSTAPSAADSSGAAGAAGAAGATGSADPAMQGFFFRAEIVLLGMGNDAIPEISQASEPAPEGATPRQRTIIR